MLTEGATTPVQGRKREKASMNRKEQLARRSEPHCWADGPEEIRQKEADLWWQGLFAVGSTCMLPDGHEGEHQFTPDDQVTLSFEPKEEES
jgi:hypothetical protein